MVAPAAFSNVRIERTVHWETDPEGRVVVYQPRFGTGTLAKRLAGLLGFEPERIRLDPMGTLVWQYCDGVTPARVIAEKMREEFGKEIEPAEERIREFVMTMKRAGLVEILSS